MHSQKLLRSCLLLIGLVGSLLSGCRQDMVELAPELSQPNIIFLLTDDHRWDALGVAGNPIIQTPQLDDLARTGVRFRNAFVTTPICMTSRASFLSGQYERRHGIHTFAADLSPEAFAQTYPALLRRAGYWSGFIGKYGVGQRMPVDKFDVWHGFPGQGKYETVDPEGRPIHLTRLMGQQAIEFLQSAPADRPFVLSVSFKAPHVQDEDPRQFIPDPAHLQLYRDATIPVPPTATSGHLERLPSFLQADSTESRALPLRAPLPALTDSALRRRGVRAIQVSALFRSATRVRATVRSCRGSSRDHQSSGSFRACVRAEANA
jgi:hypothetical protein